MKNANIVLLLSLLAVPLSAQYVPPARDFQEASRLASECVRAVEPGLASMREQHEVLTLFNRVQRQLSDDNAGALTSAIDSIDEWVRMRQQSDKPISRDMQRQIDRVRELIVLAQNGPPPTDLRVLRENIHHDHIHALQKLVLTNAGQLQQFADSQMALERLVRALITASVNAAATGSSEVKR
jgi:hypothetical protein